jgi:hypothetical protein
MATLLITKKANFYFSFVLDSDFANPIENPTNGLTAVGDFAHFKTSNGANIIKSQNILPTDVTIVDGATTYNPSTMDQLFLTLRSIGYFDWSNGTGGGGSGVNRFDELLDGFQYFGKDGQVAVVDESQLKLVPSPFYNVKKFTELIDVPTVHVAGKFLKSDGINLIYTDLPPAPTDPNALPNGGYAGTGQDLYDAITGVQTDLDDNYYDKIEIDTIVGGGLETITQNSAGAVSGFSVTNNGDGTISLSSGIALLRATNNQYAPIAKYTIPAVSNLALTDNANNFVLVDYNSGTPSITVTTNSANINTQTNSIALIASRVGNVVDWQSLVGQNNDSNAKLRVRFLNQEGVKRASGVIIGFVNRNITLTSGVLFSGLIRINSPAFNTVSPDTFTYVYNNGSVWTRVTEQTQVNNTQYNNAGTLASMPTNDYRVDYVYLLPNNPSKLYLVYGNTTYNSITLARSAPIPSSLPSELQVLGLLVGRQIIQKNSATIAEVTSAFEQVFSGAGVPEHNSLAGLQGGAPNDYQHFTTAEKADIVYKSVAGTISAVQTFLSGTLGLRNIANTFTSFFANSNTASRTYTFQDKNYTVADNADLATKQNLFTGLANFIPKSLNPTTLIASRLQDTGTFFGFGSAKSPLKDITLGNQSNREIGIEESSNVMNGRDLIVTAGRTINYVENAIFNFIGTVAVASYGMASTPSGNVYVVNLTNKLFKQTGGTGAFIDTGITLPINAKNICSNSNNDLYISATGTDIYKQTNETGSFVATGSGSRNWNGKCSLGTVIYASVDGGDIYKQTGGTGAFVAQAQATRAWGRMYASSTSIYVCVASGGIYKQTNATGTFAQHTALNSSAICVSNSNDVYINVGTDLLKQINETGAFTGTGSTVNNNSIWGMASHANGNIYAGDFSGNLYMLQNNGAGTPNLNGGKNIIKAGTGKGTGQSRIEFVTGQKTASGTNMQVETLRGYIDENGYFILYGVPFYANDAAADADTNLVSGAFYKITGTRAILQKP